MVPATIRRTASNDGLQPLRLGRDWREVLALIEVAFGEELDADARRALQSMRLPPLLSPLIGALDSLALPGEGMMPGFVWREGGRVVGTASVRRVHPFNNGWLISNVAVLPEWQGRGIGRELLEASLNFAQDFGGAWAVLQVRDSNHIARRLYESMGFQQIAKVTRLHRKVSHGPIPDVHTTALRPARWSDGNALGKIARTQTPYDVLWADSLNRNLYRTGLAGRVTARMIGCRRRWWVQDPATAGSEYAGDSARRRGSGLKAAVGIEMDSRNPWHRLRVLISPKALDEAMATELITFGLSQLAGAPPLPVEIEHPASDQTSLTALATVGFEPLYAFIHMRLNFK